MATATESPSNSLRELNDRSVLPPPDKYRGAVVEVHKLVSLAFPPSLANLYPGPTITASFLSS